MLVTVMFVLGAPTGAGAQSESAEPAEAGSYAAGDDYLQEVGDDLGIPGSAWAVVRDGEVVHVGTTGVDGDGAAVDEDTAFFLGSVSKPMLATVILDLVAAGQVALDERVIDRLPALTAIDGAEQITVAQLLEHTSGLPFGESYLDVDDPGRTPLEVVDDLDGVQLQSTPGAAYRYSSLGYVVLTAWVQERTGQSLAELAGATMGLPDLVLTPAGAEQIAPGKRDALLPTQQAPIDGAGFGYGYTAGSVRTLAAFAADTLAPQNADRLAAMTDVEPGPGETVTGLGWRVTADPTGERVWHTGTVPGYFSAVHLVPEQDLAVVLVSNRSGFLDENRLYTASAGLLAIAQGDDAPTPGLPVTQLLVLAAALAVGVGAVALLRRPGRVPTSIGGALIGLLIAAPGLLVLILGVPWRYLLLWTPDLAVAVPTIGLLALIAALLLRRRPRLPAPADTEPQTS